MAKVKSKKSGTASQKQAAKQIRSQAITKANMAVTQLQKDVKAAAKTLRVLFVSLPRGRELLVPLCFAASAPERKRTPCYFLFRVSQLPERKCMVHLP